MARIASYTQQPSDRLDYDIWYANDPDGSKDWLINGDYIESATVEASPTGLTVEDISFPDRVKLWVSQGTAGTVYKVSVTIHTVEGRIKQDELRFRIKEF